MGGTDLSFERSCERQHLSDMHAICTMVAPTFLFFPSISIIPRVLSFMACCVVIYLIILLSLTEKGEVDITKVQQYSTHHSLPVID
jgi:Ca2+/Na+ antiporter